MTKIRVGIVGATVRPVGSRWGANAHVPALHGLRDYELTAVCTAHEDSAKESAEAFGARLAFHDYKAMIEHDEIDLVSVVVRVPHHHDLVTSALRAGKAVLCEWPLAANLAEAEEMAALGGEQGVATAVGLQSRSDPTFMHARALLQDGVIGDVLAAHLHVVVPNDLERPPGRLWQGQRALGANPLTIAGGHTIDLLCFLVGELTEVYGRLSTRVPAWRNVATGDMVAVDAPDVVSFAGRAESGAEVAGQVASMPATPPAYQLAVHGREGNLTLSGGFFGAGGTLVVGRSGEPPAEVAPPPGLTFVPDTVPPGPARNVAQAYARLAAVWNTGERFEPGFAEGLRRHRLLAAIERSSQSNRVVSLA